MYWLGMDGGACTAPVAVARASSSSSLQDVQCGLLAPELTHRQFLPLRLEAK